MIIPLDEAHQFIDRQLIDEGAAFAQMKCFRTICRREYRWQDGRLVASEIDEDEKWVMRVFHSGAWGVLVANSFAELQQTQSRCAHLAREISTRVNAESVKVNELMVSKPIRQLSYRAQTTFSLPPIEDLQLLSQKLEDVSPKHTSFIYHDQWVETAYWDSEHTRGEAAYVNAKLNITHFDPQGLHPVGHMEQCIHQNLDEPLKLLDLAWSEKAKSFSMWQGQEEFRGPSPEDLDWILSPLALAKCIYATLGPSLCLERPDPFSESMNPGSIIGQKISHECLNIISSPNIMSEKSFLDPEGVPARRVLLIEDGVLKNFIFTRLSAFHLSRSLPIDKEKVLAGSSRTLKENYTTKPDLQYIEVLPGESMSSDLDKPHLFIPDLKIEALESTSEHFSISVSNATVSKYGGLHRRHIQSLKFCVSRDELWKNLQALDDKQEKVFISADDKFIDCERYSSFSVPQSRFKGFKCTWT